MVIKILNNPPKRTQRAAPLVPSSDPLLAGWMAGLPTAKKERVCLTMGGQFIGTDGYDHFMYFAGEVLRGQQPFGVSFVPRSVLERLRCLRSKSVELRGICYSFSSRTCFTRISGFLFPRAAEEEEGSSP